MISWQPQVLKKKKYHEYILSISLQHSIVFGQYPISSSLIIITREKTDRKKNKKKIKKPIAIWVFANHVGDPDCIPGSPDSVLAVVRFGKRLGR